MITESGEQIAVVANQIIRARHRLDPTQQKIIAYGIGQIARDDTTFDTVTLSVAEFARLTGAENNGRIYDHLEAVTKSLLRSIVEIRINDGDRRRVAFQWLSRCVYREGQGTVELRFHGELKPYLLELKSRFTQIRLDQFFKFRSGYTIRFFERIEMMCGLGRMVFDLPLSELRDWLGIEADGYTKISAFRAYVLDVAQKELDEKSDWSFSYLPMKTGRTITGFEFTLRPARTPKINPNRDRWKKASAELKAKVFAAARQREGVSGWHLMTDTDIAKDSLFLQNLGILFDDVDKGQTALKF